jgi:hypothetical protein
MSFRFKWLVCMLLTAQAACAQDVRIGVLGLFRPRHITVKAAPAEALVIQADRKSIVLERSSGKDTAGITVSGDALLSRLAISRSARPSCTHPAEVALPLASRSRFLEKSAGDTRACWK